jgi:hypothetical protein
MPKQKVLIAVKTYPVLSIKYQELVCTAGFNEQGEWVRIFPVPYRQLDFEKQYKKFQWITVPLEKSSKDQRPESHHLYDIGALDLGEEIPAKNWAERNRFALGKVFTNKAELIAAAHRNELSLATFKPTKITRFVIDDTERTWDPVKLAAIKQEQAQLGLDLFNARPNEQFEVAEKIPYKFFYTFEDDAGEESTLMIEDWEIGALYRHCLERHEGNEAKAIADVRKKYEQELPQRNIHFFLGTTLKFHNMKAPNPFLIVGVYYPPHQGDQLSLLS